MNKIFFIFPPDLLWCIVAHHGVVTCLISQLIPTRSSRAVATWHCALNEGDTQICTVDVHCIVFLFFF